MNKKGKVTQVKFEPGLQINHLTGETEVSKISFCLWADEGLKELIESVDGVVCVNSGINGFKTYYSLAIDPRYDTEFVKKEIEAEIVCKLGEI